MRNAKGLVQVQVTHITTKFARCGQTDQGVHVGAIHINAATVAVNQGAQFFHVGFKHTVRAGVGDHHGGQVGAVLFALGAQVGHVDIALRIAGGHHHFHAHHGRAGRVGAVCAARDQADVAVALTTCRMEAADRHHASVLALAAGIGLQADAGVTRGLTQPGAQLRIQFGVTCALV